MPPRAATAKKGSEMSTGTHPEAAARSTTASHDISGGAAAAVLFGGRSGGGGGGSGESGGGGLIPDELLTADAKLLSAFNSFLLVSSDVPAILCKPEIINRLCLFIIK
jgi:hypothetical protein